MALRRRRGWTGLIVGLIILLVALWIGYWYAARTAAETGLARLASASVACAGPRLAGFPLVVEVRCVTLDALSSRLVKQCYVGRDVGKSIFTGLS